MGENFRNGPKDAQKPRRGLQARETFLNDFSHHSEEIYERAARGMRRYEMLENLHEELKR